MIRASLGLALLIGSLGCAASAEEVRLAKGSVYQNVTYDDVWYNVISALATDYPQAKFVDKSKRKIVTCWRPIEKPHGTMSAGTADTGWYFYRAVVEISDGPPFRVSVSGRSAAFRPPRVVPIEHGDVEEPGWVGGRTDRIRVNIHHRLQKAAVAAQGKAPEAEDPDAIENIDETCVIRAPEFSIPAPWMGYALDDTIQGDVPGEGNALPGRR